MNIFNKQFIFRASALAVLSILLICVALNFSEKKDSKELSLNSPIIEAPAQKAHEVDNSKDIEGDTFSIVAYDPATGEFGGAGTSCVSIQIDFLNEIIVDNSGNMLGAINTQAAARVGNADNAKARMLAGDTPQEIINWLDANDCCAANASTRQYGIIGFDNGVIKTAAYTGSNNGIYGNSITGPNYSIQGNILDETYGQEILESMEAGFLGSQGSLADKLMAALQGAKRVGSDKRCGPDGAGTYSTSNQYNSGRASFVRVRKTTDNGATSNVGTNNSIDISIGAVAQFVEPIDVLQCDYDTAMGNTGFFCREAVATFPYTMDFESRTWEQEASCGVANAWIRSKFASPSGNTGASGANQGNFYTYFESSDLGNGLGTTGYIASPCFEIPEDKVGLVSFNYHMFGGSMGTLSLEANDGEGAGWVELWSETGDKGNSWQTATNISLINYTDKSVKLRFKADASIQFTNDFGLDNIQITTEDYCINPVTFNGSWSTTPDFRSSATISSAYNTAVNGSFDACSLTITNNTTVTISENEYANVRGNITVETGSSLLVEAKGSVVQTIRSAQVNNMGTINVAIATLPLKPRDFVLLGSPMTGDTREGAFSNSLRVFNHETANFVPHPDVTAQFPLAENFADDDFNNYIPHTGAIAPAEGFLISPRPFNATGNEVYATTFEGGTLNTGEIVYPIVFNTTRNDSYNLLANPYASAIDATTFINANSVVDEVYIWEHVQSPNTSFPGANTTNFSMEDVTMYNLMGGNTANGAIQPNNGMLSTGQGFGIKATAAGSVTFNNSMRLQDNNNTLRTTDLQTDKIWLSIKNDTYDFGSSTLIGFTKNASQKSDKGYDAKRIATVLSIFSHHEDGSAELGIQGRELFDESIQIPLGFSSLVDEESTYTISIDTLEGVNLNNATVYLYDQQNKVVINLSLEDYSFSATKGTYSNRFILQFQEREVLNNASFALDTLTIFPNPATSTVNIASTNSGIEGLKVIDIQGREVINSSFETTNSFQLNIENIPTGIYIITIETENGNLNKRFIKK